ncbi:unnamed protein product [Dovyalis caffra]|uniref:Uncharacterized protein n=1 Tax=Dovyalis caffra TaxID=77055 RepID=A0AAV1SIY5_9ROSI|nr:unnamed protein product [Dovyalis caffra]
MENTSDPNKQLKYWICRKSSSSLLGKAGHPDLDITDGGTSIAYPTKKYIARNTE